MIFAPCVLKMAEKGRPRLEVDISQVEHLLSLNFTWEQISNCIGVSVSTVQRRARAQGSYNGHPYIGDSGRRMIGMLNN